MFANHRVKTVFILREHKQFHTPVYSLHQTQKLKNILTWPPCYFTFHNRIINSYTSQYCHRPASLQDLTADGISVALYAQVRVFPRHIVINDYAVLSVHAINAYTGNRRTTPLILNHGIRWGGWSTPCPGRFTPRNELGTHCMGGWVGPRARLSAVE
jgi:hypothetical protein